MDSPLPSASPPRRSDWTPHSHLDQLTGTLLGERFLVGKRLAVGGMSVVYAGRDRKHRARLAIKVLRRREADLVRRFAAEAEVLFNLQHPNIVRVFGSGTTPAGDPYMVLAYLPGQNLGESLAVDGPLPWRTVAQLGIQLADAASALHALGIIHRDIKPANIMWTCEPGKPPTATLIDLGLARLGDAFLDMQDRDFTPVLPRHRTEVGRVLGTPHYLAPEAGQEPAHPGLDIYALATTLYELCVGWVPRRTDFAPAHIARPDSGAPEGLSRLLSAALAPDPAERLPSADHLRRGLLALLEAHPEEPAPTSQFAGLYDRLDLLGVGATCATFRAFDRRIDQELALKVLRKDTPDDDDVIRFYRAAKILGQLRRHPNVPLLYLVDETDGQPFAATELCPGVAATEFVKPGHALRPAEVVEAGLQLASVLAEVHALGVVYRDLHTGNVLIDRTREPLHVWLFDFDHSQVSAAFWNHLPQRWATPPEQRREPKREKPLVRVDHAAPELRTGAPHSPASDIFALGLLLYRLLTGMRPFPPGQTTATPPSQYRDGVPDQLEEILLLMLDETPTVRPSLDYIRTVLETCRDQLAAAERRPPRPEPPPPSLRPEPPPAEEPPPPSAPEPAQPAEASPSTALQPSPPPPHHGTPRLLLAAIVPVTLLLVALVLMRLEGGMPTSMLLELPDEPPPTSTPTPTIPLSPATSPLVEPSPPPSRRRAATSDTRPPDSFPTIMAALEPKLRACAVQHGFPLQPTTVKVRGAGAAIETVRVLGMSSQHAFAQCVERHVREARPPIDPKTRVEVFEFFRSK